MKILLVIVCLVVWLSAVLLVGMFMSVGTLAQEDYLKMYEEYLKEYEDYTQKSEQKT